MTQYQCVEINYRNVHKTELKPISQPEQAYRVV